ncbi:hypothetical protein NDU88_003342 [Pleurodeles waltl]|uniref:Uncharacterized protein n=1 Tax=Pleurodeles waltl TaxID=8319 RepID=A0AAV7M342_PLEWA|nr:hypothetical protein NDU88_003342 [Pleurodeles waltl]
MGGQDGSVRGCVIRAPPPGPSPATARPRAPSGGAAPAAGGRREAAWVQPGDRPGAWRPERRFGPRPRSSAAGAATGSCGSGSRRTGGNEPVGPFRARA